MLQPLMLLENAQMVQSASEIAENQSDFPNRRLVADPGSRTVPGTRRVPCCGVCARAQANIAYRGLTLRDLVHIRTCRQSPSY